VTSSRLFEVEPVDPEPALSANRRRTIRNQASLDKGVHPVSGLRLLPVESGASCGGCDNFLVEQARSRSKTYFKCKLKYSHGPATDLRKRWPACEAYEKDESL